MISPYYETRQKRFFDVLVALLILGLSFPIFGVLALLIMIESPGPVFFYQKRLGYHQQVFTLIKFRTMLHSNETDRSYLERWNEAPWPMFKMSQDPRYTRLGKILSRLGLDELPQLINILRGEMSIVGPRPLPLLEARALPKSWKFRYFVKPGVISEWAVAKKRYHSLAIWKELEEKTLAHGGIGYDLSLIMKTVFYLFG